MKVLTMKSVEGNATYEIHMLNPRELMPGFGGSRRGLLVGKTASMVVRRLDHELYDVEHDIHDKNVWKWLASLIDTSKFTIITEEEKKDVAAT